MNFDPLVDMDNRIINLSPRVPAEVFIDRLLRLQNHSDWQKPITVYLTPCEEGKSSLGPLNFLQIHAVMRAVRSPLHTVALGMLRGYEVLLLAAGCKGHRHLLEHSVICLEPFNLDDLPFSSRHIGLDQTVGGSLREQARQILQAELDCILKDLSLDAKLFRSPTIICAQDAIRFGVADSIVPIATPAPKQATKPGLVSEPTPYTCVPTVSGLSHDARD